MKKKSDLLLGVILIVIGGIALGLVNKWFHFDFEYLAKLWPFLIILAGVAVLIDPKKNVFNAASVLLIALAIPFGIYNCTSDTVENFKGNFSDEDFNFNFNDDDEIESFKADSSMIDNQTYKIPNKDKVEFANLKISGGALIFEIENNTTDGLFFADTKLAPKSSFKMEESFDGHTQNIDFKVKKTKVKLDKELGKGQKVVFGLNSAPIWDITTEVGASDIQFDLRKFKVETLKVETGASNLNIKMGDLIDLSKIKLESGVANINIEIPESSGCELQIDGALNSHNFIGFTKIKNGLYRTEGFDQAAKKIYIETDSGLSNISVKRN